MNRNNQITTWQSNEYRESSMELMEQSAGQIVEASYLVDFRNQAHAALTRQAMDYTSALAMAEEQLTRTAPTGQNEYREFVRSYAEGAIRRIGGFK